MNLPEARIKQHQCIIGYLLEIGIFFLLGSGLHDGNMNGSDRQKY